MKKEYEMFAVMDTYPRRKKNKVEPVIADGEALSDCCGLCYTSCVGIYRERYEAEGAKDYYPVNGRVQTVVPCKVILEI